MAATITIGEFSRLTHLPVKTLHHYHEVGVLAPAEVDPTTGYRRYRADQVADAHLIRRLRDVRMPLPEIRAVLDADGAARNAGIAAHLDRLHTELTQTATAVASLRALMATGPAAAEVRLRDLPSEAALAVTAVIARAEIGDFCARAYPRLFAAMARLATQPSGPGAALYAAGWFENGGGEVTAYVPVRAAPPGVAREHVPQEDRIRLTTVPGGTHAVALHAGGFDELDLTYGLLGRHVLDRGIGADGPIREIYLVTPADTADPARLRTEICWPIHS
jgi:DNA-binding transcriptional MerR regulator/effector-binding domain-containing protein